MNRAFLLSLAVLFALTIGPAIQPRAAELSSSSISKRALIQKKLHTILIDKFNPDGIDLTKLLPQLTITSKELDPEHVGVKFVLEGPYQPPPHTNEIHREITLSFQNVPLVDIVSYLCQMTKHEYRIEDDCVVLFPAKKI